MTPRRTRLLSRRHCKPVTRLQMFGRRLVSSAYITASQTLVVSFPVRWLPRGLLRIPRQREERVWGRDTLRFETLSSVE